MQTITVSEAGFHGIFHSPKQTEHHHLAVIVLGGSEGNENIPINVGRLFADRGIFAMGVCYWNVPGLPNDLIRVPIDPIENVIAWLEDRNFSEIYIYGISEGAKLALLCAAHMTKIRGVIALSPMHCLFSGMKVGKGLLGKSFVDCAEFTYRGKDLPYIKVKLTYGKALKNLILERQINLSYIYENALVENALVQDVSPAEIPVENIQGDILLIYAEDDLMWPSARAVKSIVQRLKQHNFPNKVTAISYKKASHILIPLSPLQLKMFKIERQEPVACLRSRSDGFEQTINWLLNKESRSTVNISR